MKRLTNRPSDPTGERAQGLLEYALIIALIAVVAILGLSLTGVSMQGAFCEMITGFGMQVDACGVCTTGFDNEEDLAGWTGEGEDNIRMKDGKACFGQTGGLLSSHHNPCSQSLGSRDFTLTFEDLHMDYKYGQPYGLDGFNLGFLEQDANNGYAVYYFPRYNLLFLNKKVSGVNVVLDSRYVSPDWRDDTFDLTVKVKGDTITVHKDDTPVLSATDSTFREGDIGLGGRMFSSACVDGISVSTP
jgi:hypothetical protein